MKINNPNNPNNQNCFKKKKTVCQSHNQKAPKLKSKSKSKTKQKKFNPLQYLNALIQLTETNSCINKKRKPSAKRDLSSALTLATPAMEKTISTSKVRSKSSYSQYRKKTITRLKQVLEVKIDNAVTQQDNIQFTELTEFSNIANLAQSIQIQINVNKNSHKIQKPQTISTKDLDNYARKIQRAWRNYQTYHVVNKYYEYFRKMSKKQKKQKKEMNQQQLLQNQYLKDLHRQKYQSYKYPQQKIIVSNSQNQCNQYYLQELEWLNEEKSKQLDKTLKIRKQKPVNLMSEHLAQQELNSTAKKVQLIKCVSQNSNKSNELLQKSSQRALRQRHHFIHQKNKQDSLQSLKQKQAQKFNEAIKMIKNQKNRKTSQQLLQQLIQKFQNNKRALEQQTEERLTPIILMDSEQFSKTSQNSQKSQQQQSPQSKKINNNNNNNDNSQQRFLSFNSNQAISSQRSSLIRNSQEQQEFQNNVTNEFMVENNESIIRLNQNNAALNQNEVGVEVENQNNSINILSVEKKVNLNLNLNLSNNKNVTPVLSRFDKSGGSFEKYEGLDEINLLEEMSNSSKSDIYNSVFDPISNTDKLFDSRIKLLSKKSQKQIEQIQKLVSDKAISEEKASQKKQQIQGRFQRQKRKIQKSKVRYYSALKQAKNEAINFQKDVIKFNQTQSYKLPIRKCFSAQSIVLKCIINQPHVLNFDIEDFQDEAMEDKLLQQSQQNSKIVINNCQSEASYFDKDFQHIQKCSQQIEKIIQKQLLNQIIEQIYTNQSLYRYFKPIVQEIFEFTKITDCSIEAFIKDILNHVTNKTILITRMNQKINPSSLEILRLIRDFDFQIDEYELILPEEVFKSMRKQIQSNYAVKIKQSSKMLEIPRELENLEVIDRVIMKQKQKRTKNQKYLNFQRDLKIMYMKSVFNCMNQFLIQQKSLKTYMNNRSSIGPGELTLSIRQFNNNCDEDKIKQIFINSQTRVQNILSKKCMIPSFKNYQQIQAFQSQMGNMLRAELDESQFKWVNFMDEVLQIWNDLSLQIVEDLFEQAAFDFSKFCQIA